MGGKHHRGFGGSADLRYSIGVLCDQHYVHHVLGVVPGMLAEMPVERLALVWEAEA